MNLFKLHGKLTTQQSFVLGVVGLVFFITLWWGIAEVFSEKKAILSVTDSSKIIGYENVYPLLPRPDRVIASYKELTQKDLLWSNVFRSIWLNLKGYFWAIVLAIPIGFFISLVPLLRGLFSKQVDALRYLPLTALTGLFIIWFGIEDQMKISFLAFGVLVYLLPIVVQRIDETEDVYLKTAYTLGAKNWQIIKSVYLPSVFSKLIDDIRVLTAISWTYIIIAELLNREGGIGALIYIKARQGQIDKVFAVLFIIIIIGFLQDRLFVYLDKRLFPNKYYKNVLKGIEEIRYGIFAILIIFTFKILQEIFFPNLSASVNSIVWIVALGGIGFALFGEFKLQTALRSSSR
jgi:NitT/TauT family transport system permease protein